MPRKFMHPKDRRLVALHDDQVGDDLWRGYVPTPPGCVCVDRCRCDEKPALTLDEAKAEIQRLQQYVRELKGKE